LAQAAPPQPQRPQCQEQVVAQVATTDSDDTGSGYRETQHVRDYYRTAKL
jgi:hypothetical protein